MAECITSSSPSYCPQVKLVVTESTHDDISFTFAWTLSYVAHGYALYTDGAARAYSVTIDGGLAKSGTFDINGKSGSSYTIASGTYKVSKYSTSRNVSFSCSFNFNATFSKVAMGTRTASGSYSIPATTSYTVSYAAPGASGVPAAQTKWHSVSLTLSTTKPTKTGYTFVDWVATNGTHYNPGDSFTQNNNSTLTAQWKKITYSVTYNANGGSGAPSNQTKTYGTNLTLSSTKPTRTGYTFAGWATSASGSVVKQPGGTYTDNASVTFYAKWTLITYTVQYNANGGSGAPGNQTKNYGQTLTLSSTRPTRANYNFMGWATSSTGSVVYSPGSAYTGNAAITLYAIWELASQAPALSNFTLTRKSIHSKTINGIQNDFNLYTRKYVMRINGEDLGFLIGDLGQINAYIAEDGSSYWTFSGRSFAGLGKAPDSNDNIPNIAFEGYDVISMNELKRGGRSQAISMDTDGYISFVTIDKPSASATAAELREFFSAMFNRKIIYYELKYYLDETSSPLGYRLEDSSEALLVDDPQDGEIIYVQFRYDFDQSAGSNYGDRISYDVAPSGYEAWLDEDIYGYASSTFGAIDTVIFPVKPLTDSTVNIYVRDTNGMTSRLRGVVKAGRYYIDYYDDPEGDVGVSIGMPASQPGFHVNPEATFHNHVHMKPDDPASEGDIYFETAAGGQYSHKASIYGASSDSYTALGAWDEKYGRVIWRYEDDSDILFLGRDVRPSRTAIPQNANLNDYLTPGHYVCDANTTVATLVQASLPSGLNKAFQMDVTCTLAVTSKSSVYMKAVITDYFGDQWVNIKNSTWGGWVQTFSHKGDHIIDCGTNHQLYANGTAKCWGSTYLYSGTSNRIATVNLPFGFTGTYNVFLTPYMNGSIISKIWCGDRGGNNAKQSGNFKISVDTTTSSYDVGVDWFAIGRWK